MPEEVFDIAVGRLLVDELGKLQVTQPGAKCARAIVQIHNSRRKLQ